MSSVTTNSLRTSLRRAASCSRYSSTQASSSLPPSSPSSTQKLDIRPKAELTEEKMRTLVDLYHQSVSFITKANLSERIDHAFIERRQGFPTRFSEKSMLQLETDLYQRRNRPKFGQLEGQAAKKAREQKERKGQDWSDQRPAREMAVLGALYGVLGRGKPGYDALMDQQRGPEVEEEVREKDALEAETGQPKGEQQQSSA